jgi:competence protein ComEC
VNPFTAIGDNLNKESDRWLLWTPVGIAAGIAFYFACPFEPALYVLAASPALGLACWLTRRRFPFLAPLFMLLTLALGFNAAQIETQIFYTPMLDREQGPLPVTGRLMFTEVMPEGVRLTLKDLEIGHMPPEKTPVRLRIKMDNKTLAEIPPPGTRIKLWAQVGPFSEPVMPHATDFRWQGYFRQLGGLGWSYSHIDIIDPNPPSTSWRDDFALMFERARLALAHHVYARLSGDVAAMTVTRLNGEQAGISKPVIEAMRIAGLAHLLSTSGFHVTIMGLLVYFPLRAIMAAIPWLALRYPIKKWAATGAIFSTLGYTFLVGSGAATLRSMLMCGIAMIAIIGDRRAAPMRLVMLSAVLAMLMAPDAALGPSFQMSFAAVFCLIASHEKTFRWMLSPDEKIHFPGWMRGTAGHVASIVTTSLIATAATTLFAVYHFQTFSFYGFAANPLAIPMTSFWVMPCILMAYILAPFGLDGWFIDGAGAGIAVTIRIAETVASWPYSIIYLPAMPWGALVAIAFGGLWLCIWKLRWRWLGLGFILIGSLYPFYTTLPAAMIAPDGKVWAARLDDGRLAVSNLDRDEFIYTQWQQRLGNPPLVDVSALPESGSELRCDDAGCVYRLGKNLVAFPILESAALEDCGHADAVVAPFIIRDCTAKNIIDEPDFWHHGSYAIYKDGDNMRIEYSRPRRGMRPWSAGWKQKTWDKPTPLGAAPED